MRPGKEGSRAGTGDSIVLGCGHTWGYTAYWDSGDSGGAEPQTLRTERLERAQRERIWASAEAHESGLSVRQIASATGLSSSRDPTPGLGRGPRDPPVATVSSAAEPIRRTTPGGGPVPGPARPSDPPCGRDGASRRCREWLERLDRGELVVVNLRPETDPETEYVAFDRPRVLRVLARIIADLDDLAGNPPIAEEEASQRRGRRGPTGSSPATAGGARPTAEAVERAGRTGDAAGPCWISRRPSGVERAGSGPSRRDVSADAPDWPGSAQEGAGDGCIEESCIRKAVTERGLIGDPVGLSDTTSIHRELEVRLADGEFLWEGVTSHGRFPRSRDSVSNTRPIIIDVLAPPRRSQWG